MMQLKTIPLSGLVNWSVQYLLESTFSYNPDYELVPIGKFLTRNKTSVDIEDNTIYKRVTIRANNLGVHLRDTEKGENIGTKKQFVIKKGQFLVSKIDARNGAFGVIPDEVDGAIITGNFWTFDVDTSIINPYFLSLIVTTPEFIKFCENASNGTTNRHYLQEDLFLAQHIPLPTIEEQNRIVTQYNQKIQLAQQQEHEADNLEQEIELYITKKLGVVKPQKSQRESNLYFTNYNELSRWDYWVNSTVPKSEKYKNDILESVVIGKPQYGANVKGVKKESDTRYIRITDINESGYLNNEFVSPASVDEKYLLKENDFLIARSGNTVGKTLLFKKKYGRAIYAGYLVRYIIDSSKIIPEYLFLFTKSFIFKEWISANQRVSGQPNINGQEFLKSPVVMPPINIQSEIVNKVSILKEDVKDLRNEAKRNKEEALLNFEQEIFNS